MAAYMTIEHLPYGKPVQSWLKDRYGETEENQIWEQTQQNYKNYLPEKEKPFMLAALILVSIRLISRMSLFP